MSGVSRLGDVCTGHGAFPPRPSISAASTVFVNGIPCVNMGSQYATHCDPAPSCHSGALSEGVSSVLVEGSPIGTIGNAIDCGSSVASGSDNVFAG